MTPFEIFRERAELKRNDTPRYKKVYKPRPPRSLVPIPYSWWYKYGYKLALDYVEIHFTARFPQRIWRVPIMTELPIYIAESAPQTPEPINYQIRTYEFERVAWVQILLPKQYIHYCVHGFESLEQEFWRQVEPLINENTRVTTS